MLAMLITPFDDFTVLLDKPPDNHLTHRSQTKKNRQAAARAIKYFNQRKHSLPCLATPSRTAPCHTVPCRN
jgi:hypothetical protein